MHQRSALLEQLATARRGAEQTEADIKDQLDSFVSGMVVGSAMAKAENALDTLGLALQGHLSDIGRILDALHKLPPCDPAAQS